MYTYDTLLSDLCVWERMGAEVFYMGQTVLGRMIPVIYAGSRCGAQLLIQGSIHAREYISSELISRQIYHFLDMPKRDYGGVCFVPMVNIDGVCLCQQGIKTLRETALRQSLLRLNDFSHDFNDWKANVMAVDLNTNFDARWGTGKQNVFVPSKANYIGRQPASEPETKMLVRLTKVVMPSMTISYHARGREIYWEFHQKGIQRERDLRLARLAQEITGYDLIDGDLDSAGGYKDYCIQHLQIPSLTIELTDENVPFPIPSSALTLDLERNKALPSKLLEVLGGDCNKPV